MMEAGTVTPGIHLVNERDPAKLDSLVQQLIGGSLYGLATKPATNSHVAFYWGPEAGCYFLFDNIRDEIAFRLCCHGLQSIRPTPESLLEAVGLHSIAPSAQVLSPHSLSGGQQQRLLTALLLARMPPLIVAQTPFVYVDDEGRRSLYSVISEAARTQRAVLVLVGEDPEPLQGLNIDYVKWAKDRFEVADPPPAPNPRSREHWRYHRPAPSPPHSDDGHLELENTTWQYADGRIGVFVASAKVYRRSICVVCGPNGGGKSSFVRILCSNWEVSPPASMRYAASPVRNPFKDLVRSRRVAFSLQDPNAHVQPLTVRDAILAAGVPDKLASALRLDTYRDEDVLLSPFWVKQAIAISVALSSPADFLVLDEPVDGYAMEIIGRPVAEALLQARDRGKGVLVVTHSREFAWAVADRFFWVEEQKVEQGVSRNELDRAPAGLKAWLRLHESGGAA